MATINNWIRPNLVHFPSILFFKIKIFKVYYYVDDQKMPYSTEVPVPPSKITLYDFKNCITKRSYKYYCKVVDAELNAFVFFLIFVFVF